jgi:hypothetical protein
MIQEIVSFQTSRADKNHVRTVVVRSDNLSADKVEERTRLVEWGGINWSDSPKSWWVQSCTEEGEKRCDGEGGLTGVDGNKGTITVVARYKSEIFVDDGDTGQDTVEPYEDKEHSSVQPASRSASVWLFPPKTAVGTAPPLVNGYPPPVPSGEKKDEQWTTYRRVKTFSTVVASNTDPADIYEDYIGVINDASSTFLPGIWAWMLVDVATERITTSRWWVTFQFAKSGRGPRGNDAVYWKAGATTPPTGKVFQGYDQQPASNIDPT